MSSTTPKQPGLPQHADSLMSPITTAKAPSTSQPQPISPATAKATVPHSTPWKSHLPSQWAPAPKPTRTRTEPYSSGSGTGSSSSSSVPKPAIDQRTPTAPTTSSGSSSALPTPQAEHGLPHQSSEPAAAVEPQPSQQEPDDSHISGDSAKTMEYPEEVDNTAGLGDSRVIKERAQHQ